MVLRLLLALQGWTWSVTPPRPTVGDTVWFSASVPLNPGWRLRPGKLEPGEDLEPLADPVVYRDGDTWLVRYAVVAWSPGNHTVTLPMSWRLGPDGRADSVLSGTVSFAVAAVIPDSVARPAPKPVLEPLRRSQATAWPLAVALLGGAGVLAGLIMLKRRDPRHIRLRNELKVELEAAESHWLAAGEPRAIAARASSRLRNAIAAAVPEAHVGLSHPECLAVVERQAPKAPLRELTVVLAALELVEFSGGSTGDVAALSRRAEALGRGIGGGGRSAA